MQHSSIHLPAKSEVIEARSLISEFVHNTPVVTSELLNELADMQLFFKCENLQKVGAFKMRGAMHAVLKLNESQKSNGVATHSSGNFAQALSKAAQLAGIKAYIVMPSNSPEVKKRAVKGYGGEIIECEPNLKARESTLNAVVKKTGANFIHPYNDINVILGNSSTAMELIEQVPDLDEIIVPVGGGGLISGISLASHYFSPNTRVWGAEPEGADDAYRSLKEDRIVPSVNPTTIADGLLTSLGDKTFPIIKRFVKGIFLVNEEEIRMALQLILERMKIVVEPSAAVAFAAALRNRDKLKGKKVGIILSGGNIDLRKYYTAMPV